MPTVSKKKEKFMQAVANNPKFAKKVGVNQSTGREFTKEKGMKTKKMMGGGMADKAGARAMSPAMKKRMEMAMMKAGAGGMKKGGKVKKGLYANIHAKKKRIAAGSKEKMRKPGSKGAPTAANFKRAAKTAKKKKK